MIVISEYAALKAAALGPLPKEQASAVRAWTDVCRDKAFRAHGSSYIDYSSFVDTSRWGVRGLKKCFAVRDPRHLAVISRHYTLGAAIKAAQKRAVEIASLSA